MRVVFLEDVVNVANAGEVRNVADGYGRNYLLPKKLATLANSEALKRTERIKEAGRVRRIRETEQMDALAQELEGVAITVVGKVSPAGRYYGAITPVQVLAALSESTHREFDRKVMEVLEPIHEPGEYEVVLHLAPDITATIIITAEAEQ